MKTFLVAVDGSATAPAVLEMAIEYARALSARLVLLRVVGLPAEVPASAFTDSPENLAHSLIGVARGALSELSRLAPPEIISRLRVELGSPWQTICDVARAEKADLVVIGSHGYGMIERVLGTTAARVVNHADRPVLVVRPQSARID